MKGIGTGIKEFKNAAKDDQPANSKKKKKRKKRIVFFKFKSQIPTFIGLEFGILSFTSITISSSTEFSFSLRQPQRLLLACCCILQLHLHRKHSLLSIAKCEQTTFFDS